MKVLMINAVCGVGSTGRICTDLAEELEKQGHEVRITYGRFEVPEKFRKYAVRIESANGVRINALKARIWDSEGLNAISETKRFLKWAEEYDPDLLWLHNIHGYYLNYELLFQWIKSRPTMQVKWTLHDCWTLTGHCTHFSFVHCDHWKTGCHDCPQLREYPASLLRDGSRENYNRKKKAFSGVANMTIYTPSNWLRNLVRESYLGEYKVDVLPNTVNREVFSRRDSDFRERYSLTDKIVLLGVASTWNERKGFYDYIRLAGMLSRAYRIVLVGVNEKQKKMLPDNCIGIGKTNNAVELAEIYSAADLCLSLSVEETFGMTIAEANACGTPAMVYQDTACVEAISEGMGFAVPYGTENVYEAITGYFGKK